MVATLCFGALAVFALMRLLSPKPEQLYSHEVLEAPATEAILPQPAARAPQPRVHGMVSNSAAPRVQDATAPAPAPAPAPVAKPARVVAAAEPAPSAKPPANGPARDRWDWAYLWKRPAEYLVRHTWLSSPAHLSRRLSHPAGINRYLERPLVRATLESPAFVRLLAGNHALVGAFLESPAMRDPKVVKELFTSPLVQRIVASRGIQELVNNPTALAQVLSNPELVTWLRSNPAAEPVFTLAGIGVPVPRRKG